MQYGLSHAVEENEDCPIANFDGEMLGNYGYDTKIEAIEHYNRGYANRKLKPFDNKGEHGTIELVTFELVEVADDGK